MATGALKLHSLALGVSSSLSISSKLRNSQQLTSRPAELSNFTGSRLAHAPKQLTGRADRSRYCRLLALPRASIDVKTTASDSSSGQKSVEMESSAVVPAVLVGYGRVGQALEKMGGGLDTVVRRGQPIPADSEGPIIVCTRNDALAAIIDSAPPSRREGVLLLINLSLSTDDASNLQRFR